MINKLELSSVIFQNGVSDLSWAKASSKLDSGYSGKAMPRRLLLSRRSSLQNKSLFLVKPDFFSGMLTTNKPEKVNDIFGIQFPTLSYEKVLSIFQNWIDSNTSHQVCIANVHTLVHSLKHKEMQEICNKSLTTMDGMPLIWYSNLIYNAGIKATVNGPDLMIKSLEHGLDKQWKHFFLGSTKSVQSDLVSAMSQRFPGIQIVGSHSPPFRPLTEAEDNALVDMINQSGADFLWVGLGAPKQEKWIADHLHRIHVPVQIGVGAAFSFHSGHVRRAPLWMQKNGLEWLYRMFKETRLIKRYLTSNPIFMALFARDILLKKILRRA